MFAMVFGFWFVFYVGLLFLLAGFWFVRFIVAACEAFIHDDLEMTNGEYEKKYYRFRSFEKYFLAGLGYTVCFGFYDIRRERYLGFEEYWGLWQENLQEDSETFIGNHVGKTMFFGFLLAVVTGLLAQFLLATVLIALGIGGMVAFLLNARNRARALKQREEDCLKRKQWRRNP